MRLADLHLHTTFSDGTYTPPQLIKEAKRVGLSCVSVVDHDTVLGIEPSLECAKSDGIEVLPGIELTAQYYGLEVHILGYLIDYKNKDLAKKLDSLKENRVERIYQILDKLKSVNIDLRPEAVFNLAKQGTVGRMHIARAMVNEGLVGSVRVAFEKYIGDNCPAYVSGFKLTPYEAINLIKDIRGIPVLAHPYSLRKDELIPVLVDYGLVGLEVYYCEHTDSMVKFYSNLAQKYNLLVTGGSDCHGTAKPEVKIGSVKIPYELVERLKETKR